MLATATRQICPGITDVLLDSVAHRVKSGARRIATRLRLAQQRRLRAARIDVA